MKQLFTISSTIYPHSSVDNSSRVAATQLKLEPVPDDENPLFYFVRKLSSYSSAHSEMRTVQANQID